MYASFCLGFYQLYHFSDQCSKRGTYRSGQNARLLLDAFSVSMRDELNLEQVGQHLALAVEETMQPTHISLWLRKNQ